MRPTLIALAAVFAGCSTFSTQTAVNSVTRTDFDDRLHDGLSEVWNTCTEPLDLEPGDTSVSLLNGCTAADTASAEGDAVVALMSLNDPIDLADAIPTRVFDESFFFEDFPWPMQNCEVTFDVRADFHRLRLLNQETEWRLHDGQPSMHIDYDFPSSAHVVDLSVDADVECPSGANEVTLQAAIDLILPNGEVEIDLTGMDLDLDVELDHTSSAITGVLDVNLNIGGVDVDTFLFDLANFLGISDTTLLGAFGLTVANLEAEVEPVLEASLADLPDVVVDGLMAAVPSGHVICDVQIVNTDDLRIVSDSPGVLQCVQIVPRLP